MENRASLNLSYDLSEAAKGSNPNLTPIVFLHGLAATRKTWGDIPLILAEKTNRKVYAYDARNYGESDFTDEFTFSLNIDDLFHFLDSVKVQKAILFGHSMGGVTAINAALRKPERVEMVISEDQVVQPHSVSVILFTGMYLKELAGVISRIPSSVDEKDAAKFALEEMYEGMSEENRKWIPKESLHKLYVPIKKDPDGRYMANYNAKGLHEASREVHNFMVEPVGSYEGPAIFLCGINSHKSVLDSKSDIRKYFPNAEFIKIEGAAHNVHAECKEKTIDTIVEVLHKYNIS